MDPSWPVRLVTAGILGPPGLSVDVVRRLVESASIGTVGCDGAGSAERAGSSSAEGPDSTPCDLVEMSPSAAEFGLAFTPTADACDGVERTPDVLILVEPLAQHWASARNEDLPIVLVLPAPPDEARILEAALAGADAVLTFDSSPADFLAAVQEVSHGGMVLAPAHVRAVVGFARGAATHPGVLLSRREAEILSSIAFGESVKQTARTLGIAPKTVENLQSRLFRKLDVRNRAQAVARAHELGLFEAQGATAG